MIFDYKRNSYMAVQSDDELLGRMARRPSLMISCMRGAGVGRVDAHWWDVFDQ
jgi:hypothetical protein